jgi:hypothetical protein
MEYLSSWKHRRRQPNEISNGDPPAAFLAGLANLGQGIWENTFHNADMVHVEAHVIPNRNGRRRYGLWSDNAVLRTARVTSGG